MHGYIKADHKDKLENRLKRIEGQVRGVRRMVDEEAYCIDILTQISSIIAATEKVAALVLRDHVDHCVKESIENRDKTEEKIEELMAAVERFAKMERS
ncbi:MAG: metal-sensitive transcriptional regulator [Actinomycetota bacterium]|nr:metal-sensitive transcriptional regulator [Actinomycetota bacterium]